MLSMVTISRAANAPAGSEHDRIGVPSTWTVQAPQRPTPQPNLVPVRPSVSRRTHKSGVSGSTSTSKLLSLTLSANITGCLHDGLNDAQSRNEAAILDDY